MGSFSMSRGALSPVGPPSPRAALEKRTPLREDHAASDQRYGVLRSSRPLMPFHHRAERMKEVWHEPVLAPAFWRRWSRVHRYFIVSEHSSLKDAAAADTAISAMAVR